MKHDPYHSPKSAVFNICFNCTEGNNIESHNRTPGAGSKRLCNKCAELIDLGDCEMDKAAGTK